MNSYRHFVIISLYSIVGLFVVAMIRIMKYKLEMEGMADMAANQVIFFIYIFMIAGWGYSVRKRVMHRRIRNCLVSIAILMLCWLFVREMKWHYASWAVTKRMLWYCYYIPMLFIPVLSFFAAFAIRKPEIYHRHWAYSLLWYLAGGLSILVITNDYHQLVFKLEGDLLEYGGYSYNWGYYLIAVFIACMGLLTVINIMRKSIQYDLGIKRYTPLMIFVSSLVYLLLYSRDSSIHGVGIIELMIFYDWVVCLIWESCIALGMVPANDYHKEFFRSTTLRTQIVDKEGNKIIGAPNSLDLSEETFRQLKQTGEKYYNSRTQLKMYPINCGYVIWQEDVGELNEMIEELYQNRKEIMAANDMAEEEMKLKVRQKQIEEQNNLYTLLTEEMHSGLSRISECAEKMELSEDEEECRRLLGRINIIGVALKRRSNFIMINEQQGFIPLSELEFCLREIHKNLAIIGMNMVYRIVGNDTLNLYEVLFVCDRVQLIVEEYLYKEDRIDVVFNIDMGVLSADVSVDRFSVHILGNRRDGGEL